MRRYFFLFFVMLASFSGWAQPDSLLPPNLRIFVNPGHSFRVKIDGVLQERASKFKVEPGTHHIELWAPHHYTYDTTVTVLPIGQRDTRIYYELTKKPELLEYEDQARTYGRLGGQAFVGGLGTVLLGGLAWFNFNRIGDLNLEYVRTQNGVDYDIPGYNQSMLDDAERDLNRGRAIQYVLYGATAGMATYTVFKLIKRRKMQKPELPEDKSFVMEGMGMGYHPQTGAVWHLNFRF